MALIIALALCLVFNFAALGVIEGLDGIYDTDDRVGLIIASIVLAPAMTLLFACLGIARFVRYMTKELQ